MATYRRYSDEEKAQARIRVEWNEGNVSKTARQLGIPRDTLYHWVNEQVPNNGVTKIEEETKRDLADMFEEYVRLALPVACDKVKEASPAALMTAVGIATDKMRLLREQSTGIQETRNPEEAKAELEAELAKRNLRIDKAG